MRVRAAHVNREQNTSVGSGERSVKLACKARLAEAYSKAGETDDALALVKRVALATTFWFVRGSCEITGAIQAIVRESDAAFGIDPFAVAALAEAHASVATLIARCERPKRR